MDSLPRQFVKRVSGQIESADLTKMSTFLANLAKAIDRGAKD
jgi:ribosomal protein S20